LESRAGIGVTGGGSTVPIADVIRMAGHANHYLAVFDGATGSALNLFRAKRTASKAQRIMLIARDGGCTKPGHTEGAYGCQAHHARDPWHRGGLTNVDDLALACGPGNRDADHGWTTTLNTRGECEWTPPPDLDHGQARINYHHRPEALLRPFDVAVPEHRDAASAASNRPDETSPPRKPTDGTPGGPGPPHDQTG
jgi:hypothetical protein